MCLNHAACAGKSQAALVLDPEISEGLLSRTPACLCLGSRPVGLTPPAPHVQIRKEEAELNLAFGTSSIQAKVQALKDHKNPEGKTTAIMLYGSARECEIAQVRDRSLQPVIWGCLTTLSLLSATVVCQQQ